jgi:hypothetical protein
VANIPKLLISTGGFLILMGALWMFGGKYFKFGHLPGDIAIQKENYKFYFPVATSILLSLLLSFVFWLIQKFTR